MTKHKKQHYIPQSYLQAWSDPQCPNDQEPYVWCFSKDGNDARKKSPKNIFHEKDMYTINFEGGIRNLVLEHGLSQLESSFANLRNQKINTRQNLSPEDRAILCAFAAAMQARTKAQREHQRKQWGGALEMMDSMIEQMKKATPEQRKAMSSLSSHSHSKGESISYEEVKNIVENPLQNLLIPMVSTSAPLLYKLDLSILVTDSEIGFITSDKPCVWYDPKAYTRPPFYRAPALIYETIEITLPISPNAMLYLNRQGINGYKFANEELVDFLNSRTKFYAHEYFIVNSNVKKDKWLDTGTEPDDSWEKVQERKKLKN